MLFFVGNAVSIGKRPRKLSGTIRSVELGLIILSVIPLSPPPPASFQIRLQEVSLTFLQYST